MLENNKTVKFGFTLAEVLVTIGVIGIVAAMTLPSVINERRNKNLELRFKSSYSLIFQAVQLMGNEDPQLWQTYCVQNTGSNRDYDYRFINDFSKQFQTLRVYDERLYYNLKQFGYKDKYFYASHRGKEYFNLDGYNNGAFIAKNGMIIFSSGCWWGALDFVVDTNGTKGSNKFGYDVFYFQIDKKLNQLLPSTVSRTFASVSSQEAGCCNFENDSCNAHSDNGSACSRYALMDIFPNDENESYWKNLPPPW